MLRLGSVLMLLAALAFASPAHAQSIGRGEKLMRGTGKIVGLVSGVAVTTALRFSKKWNRPMRGADGQIEKLHVRGYGFTLRERHRPVLGPKILAWASKLGRATRLQRLKHGFVLGLGEGAAIAPPLEGRIEARVAARLRGY
jgi:hypothetical protein